MISGMAKIIDASVAIKWFVTEAGHDRAMQLLSEIVQRPRQFAVPELFFFELIHVFHRVLPQATPQQINLLEQVMVFGWQRFVMTPALLKETRRFQSLGLSGYDGSYVALAKQLHGRWVTADQKAHDRIAHLRLSEMLDGRFKLEPTGAEGSK